MQSAGRGVNQFSHTSQDMITSALHGRGASHCHNHAPFPSLLGTGETTRAFLGAPLTSLHINLVLLVTFREEGELHPPCFHFWEWGISPKDMVVIFV